MKALLPLAEIIAQRLIARRETIAVAEILDRRTHRRGAAGRARRVGLFPRRGRGLYKIGAYGVA